jgi:hypothetical protein
MTTAFHNDPAIKAKYIALVKAHREADELMKGATGELRDGKWRGCAVACTFDKYDHTRGPVEIGIPTELMGLNDFFFENLPDKESQAWPEAFLAAPRIGADLRLVRDRFTLWLLTDELAPLKSKHCEAMGDWFRRLVNGENPSREEGEKIARAAWAAWAAWDAWDARAAWAAWAAWDARAARDASDASDARAAWAAWAAWDARDAWDASDARAARAAWAAWDAWDARDAEATKSVIRQSEALLRLMAEAPVIEPTADTREG